MKKFNELQENSERQCYDFRNKINEQKEYFAEETEILKKNHTEILELKSSINELNSALESIGNKERISKLEDRHIEMFQVEEERELRFLKGEETLQELQLHWKRQHEINGYSKRREGERSRDHI